MNDDKHDDDGEDKYFERMKEYLRMLTTSGQVHVELFSRLLLAVDEQFNNTIEDFSSEYAEQYKNMSEGDKSNFIIEVTHGAFLFGSHCTLAVARTFVKDQDMMRYIKIKALREFSAVFDALIDNMSKSDEQAQSEVKNALDLLDIDIEQVLSKIKKDKEDG